MRGGWRFGQITRHSVILVAAGITAIAQGLAIREYVVGGPRWESLMIARNIMTLDRWGVAWIIVGMLVVIFAHWPNIARTWGYTILTGWCVGWGMFYIVGAPLVERPIVAGLSNGIIWLLQGFIWWSISGLPDVAASRKGRMPQWTGSRKSD